jgi:hypothetical protein
MVEDIFESIWKEADVTYSRYYSGSFLEEP